LKPENIFLNEDGKINTTSVKIGDFGLSLLEENKHELSSIAGTQDYMAPEIKKHFNNGTKPNLS
jgi:serine/threonine protein kinase